jgi:poly(A) polymerase
LDPKIFIASDHDIDRGLIDSDALFILNKLRDAGFTAYLVGGSVRDLLIKKKPKDFDISTSAEPEQIKRLFGRSCMLIGRRFRLAHIRFGKKIFEVSTFRTGDNNESDLIVQDNEWGTPEEDVLRRDFTINGLFYDAAAHSVIDYAGGWDDIHKHCLRTIGSPEMRFKQDPVRMIRLLKFKARFDFNIDPETLAAMKSCCNEIVKSSPARVLEEILRMLESGAAAPFFRLMKEYGMLKLLFPVLSESLEGPKGAEIFSFLESADKINAHFGPAALERPILTACLIYPVLEEEIQKKYLSKDQVPHVGDIMILTGTLLNNLFTSSFSHFPRRISSTMSFILLTQYRLTPVSGKRNQRLKIFKHKEFLLALKFLKLRTLVDPSLTDIYHQWKKVYRQNEHHGDRRPHPHHSIQKAGHHARERQHASRR